MGTGINHSINELALFFGGETVYIPQRPGEARHTLADISKTKEKTNWQPEKKLEEYVEEWRKKYNDC